MHQWSDLLQHSEVISSPAYIHVSPNTVYVSGIDD